jgi:hypothetical protein
MAGTANSDFRPAAWSKKLSRVSRRPGFQLKVSLPHRLGYTSPPQTRVNRHDSIREEHALNTERDPKTPPPDRKKLILFALMLGAMSLFMYVSFMVKTAVKGP